MYPITGSRPDCVPLAKAHHVIPARVWQTGKVIGRSPNARRLFLAKIGIGNQGGPIMQLENTQIKYGTFSGQLVLPISPNLSTISVAIDGVDFVTLQTMPIGMGVPKNVGDGVVTTDTPGVFNIVPSSTLIIIPSTEDVYSYTVGQY